MILPTVHDPAAYRSHLLGAQLEAAERLRDAIVEAERAALDHSCLLDDATAQLATEADDRLGDARNRHELAQQAVKSTARGPAAAMAAPAVVAAARVLDAALARLDAGGGEGAEAEARAAYDAWDAALTAEIGRTK